MGAPPIKPAPPPASMRPAPPTDNEGAESSQIDGVPPRYAHIPTPLSNAQFFDHDAYANDHKCDYDSFPDLVSDEETSTGQYTLYCVVMQLTSISLMRAAC